MKLIPGNAIATRVFPDTRASPEHALQEVADPDEPLALPVIESSRNSSQHINANRNLVPLARATDPQDTEAIGKLSLPIHVGSGSASLENRESCFLIFWHFWQTNLPLTSSLLPKQTGCEGIMTSPGPITVFAPNDDAFMAFCQKIGKTKMEIMEHPNLQNVIKSHIVEGAHRLENMPDGTTLTTIGGQTITISGGAVNGAKFKKNDIKVDNAILHAVEGIIEA